MSDEGLSKIKAMLQAKGGEFAEKAGQKLGEAAFEAKKAFDAASPLAKSALMDFAASAKSAKDSFNKAMAEAEAKARASAEQKAAEQAAAPAAGDTPEPSKSPKP